MSAYFIRLGFLCLLAFPVFAVGSDERPTLAIIIDDMGNQRRQGLAALELPGEVTYAFLPHTPHAVELAQRAYGQGKEVMLHLPMETHQGNPLGPGALSLHMTETRFKQTLWESLDAVPHAVGLNNHMGSLLTRHPGAMSWLMQVLSERSGLYFVDSRTTHFTVAQHVAAEYGVPNTRRDVFLDNEPTVENIEKQFGVLLELARDRGHAVGIGHPYPQTVQVLRRLLKTLEQEEVRLVPASVIIELQQRSKSWPKSSSPSLKVAKSSKLSR